MFTNVFLAGIPTHFIISPEQRVIRVIRSGEMIFRASLLVQDSVEFDHQSLSVFDVDFLGFRVARRRDTDHRSHTNKVRNLLT